MTEFKTWHFSYIGRYAAYKQDKGLKISTNEISDLIESNKLIPWIEFNICHLDFWDNDAKRVMNEEFAAIENCHDFDLNNDGLSLLMTYCFIFIDRLPSRTIEDL